MKPLLMPWWDAHNSSTGAANLSKHLEKGPKPCSCLIFIFPRVPVVLKARLRAGSSPGTATSQTAPSTRVRMAPDAPRWSMGWRSSGATSQLCPLTAWLQTSPCSASIRKERGFSPKRSQPLADVISTIYLLRPHFITYKIPLSLPRREQQLFQRLLDQTLNAQQFC